MDRTQTISASVEDVKMTLLITVVLVVMVIFIFLLDVRATLIPSAVIPLALLGATAVMLPLGFSLDNLSLMALTIAVGFVVDDAIVMVEVIWQHLEREESLSKRHWQDLAKSALQSYPFPYLLSQYSHH